MLNALAFALLLAAPARVAVTPIVAGEGVQATTAAALTDALAAEVRKRAGDVITRREIASVLSYEQQRSMLGCPSEVCIAELGTVLGADRLVSGDLSKVGESLLFHVTLLDVAKVKVIGQADRRVKGGTVDDLLDALPAMAGELFGGPAAAPEPTPAAPVTASTRQTPPPTLEEAIALEPKERALLDLWTDGKGHYVAIGYLRAPFDDWSNARFFWGDGKKFFQVRTFGGGASGSDFKLSRSFWDPRTGYNGGILDLDKAGGTIDCRTKQGLKLTPVAAGDAKALIDAAKFHAPLWRRMPRALARDDDGGYYYIDAARTAEGQMADENDNRLYLGRKGAPVRVDLTETAIDDGGELYMGRSGRLKITKASRDQAKAEWLTTAGSKALVWLDPAGNGKTIYGDLGVYGPKPALGTPCDVVLGVVK
jgi:hypothetical protein